MSRSQHITDILFMLSSFVTQKQIALDNSNLVHHDMRNEQRHVEVNRSKINVAGLDYKA